VGGAELQPGGGMDSDQDVHDGALPERYDVGERVQRRAGQALGPGGPARLSSPPHPPPQNQHEGKWVKLWDLAGLLASPPLLTPLRRISMKVGGSSFETWQASSPPLASPPHPSPQNQYEGKGGQALGPGGPARLSYPPHPPPQNQHEGERVKLWDLAGLLASPPLLTPLRRISMKVRGVKLWDLAGLLASPPLLTPLRRISMKVSGSSFGTWRAC
jgi:hypothetical protein